MCLIKIRKEEEDEVVVPVRRVSRPVRRSSREVINIRTSEPRIYMPPPPQPIPVEYPPPLAVPPPQPVPIFIQPSAPIPPPQPEVHYVHVSPRSSISSDHRRHEDDSYRYRKEVRYERDYSPPRDEYYTYKHMEAPRSRSRHRERSRSRSRTRHSERDYERDYQEYDDDDGRERTVRVTRKVYRDN